MSFGHVFVGQLETLRCHHEHSQLNTFKGVYIRHPISLHRAH